MYGWCFQNVFFVVVVKFIFILKRQQCFPAGVTVGKYKVIHTQLIQLAANGSLRKEVYIQSSQL